MAFMPFVYYRITLGVAVIVLVSLGVPSLHAAKSAGWRGSASPLSVSGEVADTCGYLRWDSFAPHDRLPFVSHSPTAARERAPEELPPRGLLSSCSDGTRAGVSTWGRDHSPPWLTSSNAHNVHVSRTRMSLIRASLNRSQPERGRNRPPADEGVLTADGRPYRH